MLKGALPLLSEGAGSRVGKKDLCSGAAWKAHDKGSWKALHYSTSVGVLVLAGVELIFFIVATIRLCFGSVLKTPLTAQGWFSYC